MYCSTTYDAKCELFKVDLSFLASMFLQKWIFLCRKNATFCWSCGNGDKFSFVLLVGLWIDYQALILIIYFIIPEGNLVTILILFHTSTIIISYIHRMCHTTAHHSIIPYATIIKFEHWKCHTLLLFHTILLFYPTALYTSCCYFTPYCYSVH